MSNKNLKPFLAGLIAGAMAYLGESLWLTPPIETGDAVITFVGLVLIFVLYLTTIYLDL